MIDWSALTLYMYILIRMAGFVLFNPFFGRNGVPAMWQAGFIFLLSIGTYSAYSGTVVTPELWITLVLHLLQEMAIGYILALIMRFFFYLAEQGGEIVDTQMGMSMARTYDSSSQSSMTVTANILNILMYLIFFAANGHITLMRIILTSGDIVPFGAAKLGIDISERIVELFTECFVLGVKLAMPILGAEFLGQFGMGVLMKVIPQINVFALNIELKIIIGFVMLLFLLDPMSEFLLECESRMLVEMRLAMELAGGVS